MLKYDIDHLTAAQEVRLARATMLRLELDDCETKKLQGMPFDTNKYIAASEALERLVGGTPEQNSGPDHDRALLQVNAMIGGLIADKQRKASAVEAECGWREEMAAILAAGGDVRQHSNGGDTGRKPAPVEPQPQLPLPKRGEIPAHYLRQDEEWRRHLDASGEIVAPYFNPHG
jgi:hypothetical protein